MKDPQGFRRELARYTIGLLLACVLTGAAFAMVAWHLAPAHALAIVFGLGLVQILVHFRYFLHIDFHKSARADLQLILFSTLIIALMVGGTLVVLLNLRHRMM
jgi:cytochrome o ubiquinol oxidase operon protein cyoD